MKAHAAKHFFAGSRALPVELTEGAYVTDGSNLFRCVSVDRSRHSDPSALVEDCLTLEVLILPLEELATANLRLVEPDRSPVSAADSTSLG